MSVQNKKEDAVRGIMSHLSSRTAYRRTSTLYHRVKEMLLRKLSLEELDYLFTMCLARAKVRHPVFVATSENITAAGGPMHRQDETFTNWTKYFYSTVKAMEYCQKDYLRGRPDARQINWQIDKERTHITSGDLGFVMYEIRKVKVEGHDDRN